MLFVGVRTHRAVVRAHVAVQHIEHNDRSALHGSAIMLRVVCCWVRSDSAQHALDCNLRVHELISQQRVWWVHALQRGVDRLRP